MMREKGCVTASACMYVRTGKIRSQRFNRRWSFSQKQDPHLHIPEKLHGLVSFQRQKGPGIKGQSMHNSSLGFWSAHLYIRFIFIWQLLEPFHLVWWQRFHDRELWICAREIIWKLWRPWCKQDSRRTSGPMKSRRWIFPVRKVTVRTKLIPGNIRQVHRMNSLAGI